MSDMLQLVVKITLNVDGKPHTELTITRINELFGRPAKYKITIRRGEQTLRATLVPRRMV
ncbi:MAG: hypothetical protein ACRD8U_18145 [Pyrinomonadaceae bacterium]